MVSRLFLLFHFVSLLLLRRLMIVSIPKQILHFPLADNVIQPLPSLLGLVLTRRQQERCQYHGRQH